MIAKYKDTKNGYVIDQTSTNDEFREIIKTHFPKYHCLICNSNTAKNFGTHFLGTSTVTINNKIPDDVFYINTVV